MNAKLDLGSRVVSKIKMFFGLQHVSSLTPMGQMQPRNIYSDVLRHFLLEGGVLTN